MPQLNASIVLYHNKREQLQKVIESFFSCGLDVKLFLVDNSATDALRFIAQQDDRIVYIFNNVNSGQSPIFCVLKHLCIQKISQFLKKSKL